MVSSKLVLGSIVLATSILAMILPVAVYTTTSLGRESLSQWVTEVALKYVGASLAYVHIAPKLGAERATYDVKDVSAIFVAGNLVALRIAPGEDVVRVYGASPAASRSGSELRISVDRAFVEVELSSPKRVSARGTSMYIEASSARLENLSIDVERSAIKLEGVEVRKSATIVLKRSVLRGSALLGSEFEAMKIAVDDSVVKLSLRVPPGVGVKVIRRSIDNCVIDVARAPCIQRCIAISIDCSNSVVRIGIER